MARIQIVIFLLFLFPVNIVHGQSLGLKTGGNLSTLESNADLFRDRLLNLSFNAGIFGDLLISEIFFTHHELIYSNKGVRFSNKSINQDPTVWNLNYLSFINQFGVSLINKLGITIGPSINLLLFATQITPPPLDLRTSITEVYERLDIGVNIGLFYGIFDVLRIGFNGDYGLLNIDNRQVIMIREPPVKIYNISFSLSVYYLIVKQK